jgi:hypothetical protein
VTGQAALDIATAFLDAWTGRDFQRAGTFLADDFVFDGPRAHYRSATDFLAGSERFVRRIEPRWTQVSAFGDDDEALLLYDLWLLSGASMRVTDHYRVSNGVIEAETILWDSYGAH